MEVVVVLLAFFTFVAVWWWLAQSLRKSGRGFLVRHLMGCIAGWMAGFLVMGAAITMGVIEAKALPGKEQAAASLADGEPVLQTP